MSKVVFYCRDDRSKIESTEYYKQDLDALRQLGHEVVVCTRYSEIPLSFDAIFIWWWTFALYPVLLGRLLRRPSIVTGVFNFLFPEKFEGRDYFRRPALQRFLIASATRLATMNLFVTENEAHQCSTYFSLRSAHFFPCVLNEDYMQGPSEVRQLALFNIAWSGTGNLIRKGIPELLQAVHQLKNEEFRVSLYLAGHEGDGRQFLADMIRELDIQDRVTCLGSLSRAKKIELLRTFEIFVQPSHFEGFGLATAEAMGSGACVITCDVGAVRSVVGDCGLYVEPGSPSDLARAIKRVMTDERLRRTLQQDAAARASTVFRAEVKLNALRSHLQTVGITS